MYPLCRPGRAAGQAGAGDGLALRLQHLPATAGGAAGRGGRVFPAASRHTHRVRQAAALTSGKSDIYTTSNINAKTLKQLSFVDTKAMHKATIKKTKHRYDFQLL